MLCETLWLLYTFIPFPWRKQQKASKVFPSQNKVYSVSAPATSLPVNSAGNSSIDDSKLLTMTVSMHRNRSCIQGHSKYKRSRLIHRIPVEPEQERGTKELISDSESDPEELTSAVESKKVCSVKLCGFYTHLFHFHGGNSRRPQKCFQVKTR